MLNKYRFVRRAENIRKFASMRSTLLMINICCELRESIIHYDILILHYKLNIVIVNWCNDIFSVSFIDFHESQAKQKKFRLNYD